MGNPRELITELLGEEETAKYFEGIAITVEGKIYDYIIERKRGYANLTRKPKPTNAEEESKWKFLNAYPPRDGGSIHIPAGHEWQIEELEDGTSGIFVRRNRRRHYRGSESGKLKAWNIDDAVASFIVAARNGKVDWRCGNIDVRLPKNMPPRDLSPLTFIKRGIITSYFSLIAFLAKIPPWFKTENVKEFTFKMAILYLINFPITASLLVAYDPHTPTWLNIYGIATIFCSPLIIGLLALIKYYFMWKTSWEVKLET